MLYMTMYAALRGKGIRNDATESRIAALFLSITILEMLHVSQPVPFLHQFAVPSLSAKLHHQSKKSFLPPYKLRFI